MSAVDQAAEATTDLTTETSLCAVFQRTAARVPDRVALRTLGDVTSITWGEYAARVEAIAAGLAGLGVQRGGAFGMMLTNRPEFHLLDTAALHLGAVGVSIYNTLPPADAAWIAGHAGVEVIATEKALLPTVLAARDEHGGPQTVIVVDDDVDGTLTLADVEAAAPEGFDLEAAWHAVGPDDVACLIYTSGTTGRPKGVELTHKALLGNLQGMDHAIGSIDGARVISFLPMAHIGERQFSHYRSMAYGFTATCCDDLRQLPAYLPEVRPQYLFSPPRLFEKLRSAIERGIGESEPARREAAQAAIATGLKAVRAREAGELSEDLAAEWATAREQVLTPTLAKLGLDQVAIALTGSSPVALDLLEWWHALGLPLMQAWGMSETGAFGAFTRPGEGALGTCGKPLPGVELRLLEDGEIVVRSPWLMRGYKDQPEQTAETVDADGWLHSGDIGELTADGDLKIVDRKKELIINAFGKNMSPANIEFRLKEAHPLIGQACVIGDSRPYNVALLALDPEAAPVVGAQMGLEDTSTAAMAADARVLEAVGAAVEQANAHLSRVEQIKKFRLLAEEWLPAGDELTPTMKLKRKPIAAKYAAEIEALYAG